MFQNSIGDRDFRILLNIIHSKYGYDFSGYSKSSFKRRLLRLINKLNLNSYKELNELIVKDADFFNSFLEEITVNITELFRDPLFFKTLKEKVIPVLSTYPHIRIWHAGCSSGEEVYSMAILLKEAGILERSILYATDINNDVLESAKEGRFSLDNILNSNVKYKNSGGTGNFLDYFKVKSGKAIFNEGIRNKIVFSSHNLVNDQSFNEFHLIVCRNVLIYFDKNLQDRVVSLFKNSLISLGFLALGTKENINFSQHITDFNVVSKTNRIWRKVI
jgi:chemotaxis protein methyltransferase CheR